MSYKILVSGSREIPETEINIMTLFFTLLVAARENGGVRNIEVISGGARGADTIAKKAARKLGISFIEIKADWESHGKYAGPIRNGKMLDLEPDIVWAFPLGKSPGTRNCISQAKERNIKIVEIEAGNYFEIEESND